MSSGIAIIKVGGSSNTVIAEKKDRIIDAINAVRGAVQEGVLPGGGFALLYLSLFLDDTDV